MRSCKQNIAIALIGIFLFPIVFQSIHIGWHSSHAHHSGTTTDEKTVSNHTDQDHFIELVAEISEVLSSKKCPVCDYQFATSELYNLCLYNCTLPKTIEHVEKSVDPGTLHVFLSKRSSRAPPKLETNIS